MLVILILLESCQDFHLFGLDPPRALQFDFVHSTAVCEFHLRRSILGGTVALLIVLPFLSHSDPDPEWHLKWFELVTNPPSFLELTRLTVWSLSLVAFSFANPVRVVIHHFSSVRKTNRKDTTRSTSS
jgi:hypothetical protein